MLRFRFANWKQPLLICSVETPVMLEQTKLWAPQIVDQAAVDNHRFASDPTALSTGICFISLSRCANVPSRRNQGNTR